MQAGFFLSSANFSPINLTSKADFFSLSRSHLFCPNVSPFVPNGVLRSMVVSVARARQLPGACRPDGPGWKGGLLVMPGGSGCSCSPSTFSVWGWKEQCGFGKVTFWWLRGREDTVKGLPSSHPPRVGGRAPAHQLVGSSHQPFPMEPHCPPSTFTRSNPGR